MIKNTVNRKVYVGQSVDIDNRIQHHFSYLRRGAHQNAYLQNAFNKYGESCFSYSILEKCETEELDKKEIFWINELKSLYNQNGYNFEGGGTKCKIVSEKSRLAQAKSVILLNTLEVFNSKNDAIRKTGALSLHDHLKGNSRYAGETDTGEKMVWLYLDDYINLNLSKDDISLLIKQAQFKEDKTYKIVVCLNNGKYYTSRNEVAKMLNVTLSSLNDAIKGRSNSCGIDDAGNKLVWRYLDDYKEMTNKEILDLIEYAQLPGGGRNKREVICLNNNKIYKSIKYASECTNISPASIIHCCQHNYNTAEKDSKTGEKLKWMYYEEYLKAKPNSNVTVA